MLSATKIATLLMILVKRINNALHKHIGIYGCILSASTRFSSKVKTP